MMGSEDVRTEVWTRPELLDVHATAVDELLAHTGAPLTAGRVWWGAWLASFPDASPWIVVRIDPRGRLLALAPLARRERFGRVELVGLGDGVSDHQRLPARSDADADVLADAIASHLHDVRRPWSLALRQVPPDDHVAAGLVTRLRHATLLGGGASPRTTITSRSSSDYLSRNYRKIARNRFNRLESQGHEPRVEFLHHPDAVTTVLDEIVRICRTREQQMMGRSHLDDPRFLRFFRLVTVSLAEQDLLEVALLRAGDRIAAYQLHLLDDGVYRMWNGHHDPAWAEFSPGHVLDHLVIQRVLEDDAFREIDWMLGTQPYKLRAATHTTESAHLLAASSRATSLAAFGPQRLRDRMVAMAREDERGARALEFVRQARRHLPGRSSA